MHSQVLNVQNWAIVYVGRPRSILHTVGLVVVLRWAKKSFCSHILQTRSTSTRVRGNRQIRNFKSNQKLAFSFGQTVAAHWRAGQFPQPRKSDGGPETKTQVVPLNLTKNLLNVLWKFHSRFTKLIIWSNCFFYLGWDWGLICFCLASKVFVWLQSVVSRVPVFCF